MQDLLKDAGVKAVDLRKMRNMMWDKINLAKTKLDPSEVLSIFSEEYKVIISKFFKYLKDMSLLTFGDMIHEVYLLLQNNEPLSSSLASSYLHVLVDEFQDTNAVQNALLTKIAAHGRVSIVGDWDQVRIC
jgi:superfamily I DNA/RNA helicase